MSKWLELKKRIESIPEKKRRKNLVGKLVHYSQQISQARDSLIWSVQAQSQVRKIFPSGNFQPNLEQARKASNTARSLQKKLEKQVEAIKEVALDKQFLVIDDCAKIAKKNLKEQWAKLLTRKITDFEGLVNAAMEARLEGSKDLDEILRWLSVQTENPPDNDAAVRRIETDLRRLENSVSRLGLNSRAGEFLKAAAAGRGNPKDLCDPDVVAFIEHYGLWNLLIVKLG